jgi:branched-chain amino acid transport system permease protein
MRQHLRAIFAVAFLLLLALFPLVLMLPGGMFYLQMMMRMMIFAMAAASLDFILGFGGMPSFGHAAFLGLGAYVVGLSVHYGLTDGFLQFALVIVASASFALLMGAVCVRTRGLYFIMITLAFAQSLYFVGIALKQYGGDDGFSIQGHSVFTAWLDLANPLALYFFVLATFAASLFLLRRFVDSSFGMALRGIRTNERRVQTLGLPTFGYKLAAFVISGTICGIAGGLLANLTQFVSPAYLHWTRSGELLLMVIMGGSATIFGPVLGAMLFLLLEETLSSYTEHWQIIFGPILILLVLFARNGLIGMLAVLGSLSSRRKDAGRAARYEQSA